MAHTNKPESVPDNYNENQHIVPYGSNVGSPSIVIPDTELFKSERGTSATNYFKSKLDELNKQYKQLVDLANQTELVYNSKYNFVPRVGQTYHLYTINGKQVLSMIAPHEWDKEFLGSFRFTADNTWERTDG